MDSTKLFRYSGISVVGAGIGAAIFWLLAIPFESFAGPEVPLHPLFVPGQVFHVLGAIMAIFGYTGLYLYIRESTGWLGLVAYVIAVLGAIAVFGDGIIALVTFPELAQHAPALTDATGPMFTGRVLGFYILFFATNMIGSILLGVVILQSGKLSRPAAVLLILGAILSNLPPNPALHLILILGGLIWGVSAVWLGYALTRSPRIKSA